MRINNEPKLELTHRDNEISSSIPIVEANTKCTYEQPYYQPGISNVTNQQIPTYPSYMGLQLLSSAGIRTSQDAIIYNIRQFPHSQQYFPTNIRNKPAFYYPNQSNAYY